jgi:uncharacterized protein (TIGR00369 family)
VTHVADSPEAPPLTGLERVRALLSGRIPVGMVDTLGFCMTEAEEGRVVFEGEPGRSVYNPMGTVHGGYAATLLDSACGCAVLSKLGPRQGFTTLELKVAYHKAMTDRTGRVIAEARVTSFGRRAAFTEATLKDAEGRLYATATSTLLVFEQ